jgi:Protein of unknown function (DUF3048) N-terminal domain/Protein of unknown function (DUF3048) C-terminal domain
MMGRGRTGAQVLLVVVGLVAISLLGGATVLVLSANPSPSPSPSPSVTASPSPSPSPIPSPSPSPTPTPSPSPTPSPTPRPEAYEDLSGIATTKALAHRYPLAVMIDDHPDARAQAGLASASVVWQAPVEGYIPRYMAMYQAGTAPNIGPVRSARFYFVKWASEVHAVYGHWGGPDPLLGYLNGGNGHVVNADGGGMSRVGWRAAPHNVYTTGEKLRKWAEARGATADALGYDGTQPGVLRPFRDAVPVEKRGPDGGTIRLSYELERVDYSYDRGSSTWLRSVDGRAQYDALDVPTRVRGSGTGPRIAPRTVVVMVVPIRRSGNIHGPALGAMLADSVGRNTAWMFIEGRVIKGQWEKKSETARTRFLGPDGKEVVLPRGQLFVQVITGHAPGGTLSFDVEEAP